MRVAEKKVCSFDDAIGTTYNGCCCFLDKQGTRLSDDQNLPHLARRAKVEVYFDSGWRGEALPMLEGKREEGHQNRADWRSPQMFSGNNQLRQGGKGADKKSITRNNWRTFAQVKKATNILSWKMFLLNRKSTVRETSLIRSHHLGFMVCGKKT